MALSFLIYLTAHFVRSIRFWYTNNGNNSLRSSFAVHYIAGVFSSYVGLIPTELLKIFTLSWLTDFKATPRITYSIVLLRMLDTLVVTAIVLLTGKEYITSNHILFLLLSVLLITLLFLSSTSFVRFCKNYLIRTGRTRLAVPLIKSLAFIENAFEQRKDFSIFTDSIFLFVLTVFIWSLDLLAVYVLFVFGGDTRPIEEVAFFWSSRSVQSLIEVPGTLVSRLNFSLVDEMLRAHLVAASLVLAYGVFYVIKRNEKRNVS